MCVVCICGAPVCLYVCIGGVHLVMSECVYVSMSVCVRACVRAEVEGGYWVSYSKHS